MSIPKLSDPYYPIDCAFHDLLLDRATRKQIVKLKYYQAGEVVAIASIIKDVYTKNGEEFMILEHNLKIRLDMIRSIDGQELSTGSCKL